MVPTTEGEQVISSNRRPFATEQVRRDIRVLWPHRHENSSARLYIRQQLNRTRSRGAGL